MNKKNEFLYVEKYRPSKIDECILSKSLKTTFNDILKSKEIPNMLFSGGPGVGKTTVAKALCNELQLDYLFINGSEEGNIDTLRGKIKQFASTISLQGGYKVVILDECLDHEEAVRVGTVNDWIPIALKDLDIGKQYPIVSYNMNTNEFENDVGEIISDKDDMVYEVTMDNGKTIRVTDNHPFIVKDSCGKVFEMSIRDGLLNADVDIVEIN